MAISLRTCSAAFTLFLLGAGCAPSESPCPTQQIRMWSAEGQTEVYVGDDLFVYINGGAEIYHEYGFVQVAVQRYRRGDDSVTVEIYTMEGDAFGIYSFARSSHGQAVDLGNGATSADHYLHVWSGPDLAVITAENEFEDLGEAVSEIATAVVGCLKPGGVVTGLLDSLPAENRVAGSEVYFTGRLAFVNVARPVAPLFSGFDDGVTADYGSGEQIVLLRFKDKTTAERALEAARQSCMDSGGIVVETEDSGVTELESGGYRFVADGSGDQITLRVRREEE